MFNIFVGKELLEYYIEVFGFFLIRFYDFGVSFDLWIFYIFMFYNSCIIIVI